MHPTTNIHRDACLSWPGRPLQEVYKGICVHPPALCQYLAGEGASRKSEWVSLTKEATEAFNVLKSVYDCACLAVC